MLDNFDDYARKQINACIADGTLLAYHSSATLGKHYNKLEVQIKKDSEIEFMQFIQKPYGLELKRYFWNTDLNSKAERNQEIYNMYRNEKFSQEFISKIFGLSQSSISNIIRAMAQGANDHNARIQKLQ